MPAAQDLNRPTAACANPFQELQNHVNEYTAGEIATLQSRLDKQLGPEYISTRPGAGGGKVHYLAAEKVINLANEVFGFNGWSSQIQKVDIDFVDEREGGRITLGLAVIVRVTLRDGTFHEDMGYGHIENCKGKAAAFEKARKEAATDALKRSLRNFGKVLGNCLYDKDYLSRVTKVKVQPSRWDETNLHRHADYAPVKKEPVRNISEGSTASDQIGQTPRPQLRQSGSAEFEDDFGGGNLFDGVEMTPEEAAAALDADDTPQRPQPPKGPTNMPAEQQPPAANGRPPGPQRHASMPVAGPARTMLPPNPPQDQTRRPQPPSPQPPQQTSYSTPPNPESYQHPPPLHHHDPSSSTESANANVPVAAGFVSSRAVIRGNPNSKDEPLSEAVLAQCPRFDPNTESPSIPKTSGVNHSVSRPVKSAIVGGPRLPLPPNAAPPAQPVANNGGAGARNFVNPSMDASRRIGMAAGGGAGSPLGNRSTFKQPGPATAGVKRPLPADTSAGPGTRARQPLGDVSNTTAGGGGVASPVVTGGSNGPGMKPGMDMKAMDESTKRARTIA